MELARSVNFKNLFVIVYVICFFVYLFIGFQPTNAEEISGEVKIPSINLVSDVTTLELQEGELKTPDLIVGSFSNEENKTLLIGHSTAVFENLDKSRIGEIVLYNQKRFKIIKRKLIAKEAISMREVLRKTKIETLEIMTCAGELLSDGDATHRLIITAVAL